MNIKGKWRLRLRGSFTIEAAVIVPIIMLIIAAMLNLSFRLQDSVALVAAEYETYIDEEISNMDSRETLLLYKSICDGVGELLNGN